MEWRLHPALGWTIGPIDFRITLNRICDDYRIDYMRTHVE